VGQLVEQAGPRQSLSAVFVGEGTLLARCAETYLSAGHRVRAIVSREPKVREWAARQGIPLLETAHDLVAAQGTAGEPFDYLFSVVNWSTWAFYPPRCRPSSPMATPCPRPGSPRARGR
jgi:hypothetical protein